jgi:hydrogenase maturation protease
MNEDPALQGECNHIVIMGLGNLLLGDEGVGVHFVYDFAGRYHLPAGVEVVDAGTSAMDLLDIMAGADLLVLVDAMELRQPPGSIACFAREHLLADLRPRGGLHQMGVADALLALSLLDRLPREVLLIGIQPDSLELALELTSIVRASLPVVRRRVLAALVGKGVVPVPRPGISPKTSLPPVSGSRLEA